MAEQQKDYSQYEGKRVVLTQNLKEPNEKGESAVEIEGTVQSANALGVLIKPKGKTNFDLIEAGEIEDIVLAPEKAATLKAKVLKPVDLGSAKAHLLERHGYTLSSINGMTEEAAFEFHAGLDHVELDLGHVHGDKASDRAKAAEAGTEESAVTEEG